MAPVMEFDGPPSVVGYMLGAVLPPRRRPEPGGIAFPPLRVRWTGFAPTSRDRRAVQRVTGLGDDARLELVLPHFAGFRAVMALLTHPSIPLPVWRAMQVRNSLRLLERVDGDESVLEAWVADHRFLEKGVEVDLHASLSTRGRTTWESVNAIYYRGRFARPGDAVAPASRPPSVDGPVVATWKAPRRLGLEVARVTGDYNPLHWWSFYSRRMGFAGGSFLHPQVPIGQCLAHLPGRPRGVALRLDTWIRGQVYVGLETSLRVSGSPGGSIFELRCGSETRPALFGRLGEGS